MHNWRRALLAVGAVAAIGTAGGVGTFAAFTNSQSNNGNTFQAGGVAIDLSHSAFDTHSNLAVGDTQWGLLQVDNTGKNAIKALTVSGAADSGTVGTALDAQLAGAAKITVYSGDCRPGSGNACPGPIVDSVALADFNAGAPVTIFNTSDQAFMLKAPSGSPLVTRNRQYTVKLTIASGVASPDDNALAGKSGRETLTVLGTQRDGTNRASGDTTLDF